MGEEDFASIINSGAVYVDKTGSLRRLLTSGTSVLLLTRPRRFGKSLTLNMIQNFLEMNYSDPSDRSRSEKLFQNLTVFKEDQELCEQFMGRYPVVTISLKSTDGPNFSAAVVGLLGELTRLAEKFEFLRGSANLTPKNTRFLDTITDYAAGDKPLFTSDGTLTPLARGHITGFLRQLTDLLHKAYGTKVYLLIDEYDVPLQKARLKGYYEDMLDLMRGVHATALKGNNNLGQAFVTGCMRITYQSIFNDANNFGCSNLQDTTYSDLIGLTLDEVKALLNTYGMSDRLADVVKWYDGYLFGNDQMFCPWSVLWFLAQALNGRNNPRTFEPQNYWINTSGNDIVELCMRHPNPQDSWRMQNLLNGGVETVSASEFTTYPEITTDTDFDTFALMMLHTGYLTYARNTSPIQSMEKETASSDEQSPKKLILVKIPNEEVRDCFRQKAQYLFSKNNPVWVQQACQLGNALFAGDVASSKGVINQMLMIFISIRDTTHGESYYHGFLTGVLGTIVPKGVNLKSNSESGCGYSDIILRRPNDRTAVILELKKSTDGSPAAMEKECRQAVNQIDMRQYDFDLRQEGYTTIRKYGIAFWNKNCEILMTN